MSQSISSVGSSPSGLASVGADVALQAKHGQCLRQLGDWEACPSSKTPEGKKIIDNLRSQIQRIESQMGTTPATATATATASPAAQPNKGVSVDTLGGMINLYA